MSEVGGRGFGSSKAQIAKNTTWNYVRTGMTLILRLLLLPIMLGKLGASTYGVYVLVGAVTETSSLVQSGFGLSITKYVSEFSATGETGRLNRLVNTAMIVFIVSGLALLAAYLIFIVFFLVRVFKIPDGLEEIAIFYALLMLVAFSADYMQRPYYRMLEGVQRYDVLAIMDIAREALRFVLLAGVLLAGRDLLSVGFVNVCLAVVALVVHVFFAARLLPEFRFDPKAADRNEFWRVFDFSWKMTVGKLSGYVGDRLNPWLVGIFLGADQVAVYSIADRIHSIARTPATVMGSALVPVASELAAKDERERLAGLYLRGAKYTVAVSLPFIVTGIIEARWIIEYWLPDGYDSSVPLVQLYLSYLIFYVMTMRGGDILIGTGRLNLLLKPLYLATTVNFAVSVWLVQSVGTAGVIIGSVVGNLIIWAISLGVAFSKFEVPPGRFLREVVLRVYLVAAVVYTSLWYLTIIQPPSSMTWVIGYGAIAALAFGVLFLTVSILPSERDELRRLLDAGIRRFSRVAR